MTLNAGALEDDLEDLMTNHGTTAPACATLWAAAFGSYAGGVVPPSTTVSAAQATLTSALAAAFATPAAAGAMDAAFTAAAATIAGGMAPAFVGVPPPAPVGWVTLLIPPYAPTAAAAAATFAAAIDSWMKSGTATPSGGGPPVPWS